MSFIVEQAGDASSTGYQDMMDVTPTALHQRIGVIMGSKDEVGKIVSYSQSPK